METTPPTRLILLSVSPSIINEVIHISGNFGFVFGPAQLSMIVSIYVVFSWLCDCLHIERVKADGEGGEVLLYLSPHHRPGVPRGVAWGVSLPDHGVRVLELWGQELPVLSSEQSQVSGLLTDWYRLEMITLLDGHTEADRLNWYLLSSHASSHGHSLRWIIIVNVHDNVVTCCHCFQNSGG